MQWITLSEDLLPGLIRFLGPREAHCTAFTEKLISDGRPTTPAPHEHRVAIRQSSDGTIDGAILQSKAGLYYPVLSESRPQVEREAITLLRRATRRIYSVMGKTADVSAFEEAVRKTPSQAVEYDLMCQDEPPPDIRLPRLPDGIRIRRSHPGDARALATLQKLYEIEEVLLPGNTFDPISSLNHLRETLETQIVVHAEVDGRPVAKAGTNARGFFFDQIGGVFTEQAYRRRGISTALMLRLISILAAEKKSATLFVKLHNKAATSLYRNLGFGVLDGFRISYYR